MIYLYGVTDTPPHGFRGLGMDGEPAVSVSAAGLHLVYSVHTQDFQPAVTPEAVWAHEGIVDELLEAGPVVPFRFGTTLADRDAAQTYLSREAERLEHTLAGLRGRVELAVRLGVAADNDDAHVDGAGYLAGRARAREASAQLLAPLDALAAASTHRGPDAARVVRASYLVAREDVDEFASVVRNVQERNPDLALSCTGPWAPYSFVGAEE